MKYPGYPQLRPLIISVHNVMLTWQHRCNRWGLWSSLCRTNWKCVSGNNTSAKGGRQTEGAHIAAWKRIMDRGCHKPADCSSYIIYCVYIHYNTVSTERLVKGDTYTHRTLPSWDHYYERRVCHRLEMWTDRQHGRFHIVEGGSGGGRGSGGQGRALIMGALPQS